MALPPFEVRFGDAIRRLFGGVDDPIATVEARAEQIFPGARAIVWEGDAMTFQFSFVGRAAEEVLGYPARRWIEEPTFWADIVVHPDDREDAIAYCALATGACRDHTFEYRARAANGRIIWLRDLVQVIVGRRGIPERLRGVMFDVTQVRADLDAPAYRDPPAAELRAG